MTGTTKSTQDLISWIKTKVAANGTVAVSYLEPGDHLEADGHIVSWSNDRWFIQMNADQIPEDWDDETKQDFLSHPCSVDMTDPRQLVNVSDEEGNVLLSRAITQYCKLHKVDR